MINSFYAVLLVDLALLLSNFLRVRISVSGYSGIFSSLLCAFSSLLQPSLGVDIQSCTCFPPPNSPWVRVGHSVWGVRCLVFPGQNISVRNVFPRYPCLHVSGLVWSPWFVRICDQLCLEWLWWFVLGRLGRFVIWFRYSHCQQFSAG